MLKSKSLVKNKKQYSIAKIQIKQNIPYEFSGSYNI